MTAGAFPADGPWVERWLSKPRFAVYVRACGGDRTQAIMLYQWNAATSQAFGLDLGHLEVALRNAYDTAITTRWGGSQHWLLDPESPVRRPLIRHGIDHNGRRRAQIAEACDRAGGPAATPGKIIAELPFGFWRFLSSASRQSSLWMPYLSVVLGHPRPTQHLGHYRGRRYTLGLACRRTPLRQLSRQAVTHRRGAVRAVRDETESPR
jgi:hypothetical protein